jgi:hypothetical protein
VRADTIGRTELTGITQEVLAPSTPTTIWAESAELRAEANKNSTNSLRPPSSDSPFTRPPPKKKGEPKPGGQPGHNGVTRELVPSEEVDERFEIRPRSRVLTPSGRRP